MGLSFLDKAALADNLQDRGPQDRARVNVNEPRGISVGPRSSASPPTSCRNAVTDVGVSADAVEQALVAAR